MENRPNGPTVEGVGLAPPGYRLVRELHRGPNACTLLCQEGADSSQVVVKVAWPGKEDQLRAESRRLLSIVSERILRPKKVGSNYLTFPHLRGSTLAHLVATRRPGLSRPELVTLGLQILEVIDDIHQGGVLHGDLHPGNLICQDGIWYVIDFDLSDRAVKGGHLKFAAPERLGLIQAEAGAYSDLYAVGRILEFAGARKGMPEIAEFLDRLCFKEPSTRYQTALGALLDFRELARCGSFIVLGLHDSAAHLTRPSMCGREAEFDFLRRAWLEAQNGHGQVIWVTGEAGIGKTRLSSAFCGELEREEALILQTSGNPRVSISPSRQWADQLLALRPEFAFSLSPYLRTAAPDHSLTVALLDILSQLQGPTVLLADDGHWMSTALQDFSRTLPLFCERVLLVVFSRPCELPEGLRLTRLSALESERLLRTMAGDLPSDTVRHVVGWAQGSPLMLEGALRGLVEKEVLVVERGRWKQMAMSSQILGRREATWLKQRVRELPWQARETAEALSVLGPSADISDLTKLLGYTPHLKPLLNRHLVTESGDTFYFSHDLIGEAVRQSIGAEKLVRYHSVAASQATDPFRKAYHWYQAGHLKKALEPALEALHSIQGEGRSDQSVLIHEIALECLGESPRETRLRGKLHARLSLLLELAGDLSGADRQHQQALELIANPRDRASLKLREAYRAFLHKAHARHGLDAIRQALRLLGKQEPPKSTLALALAYEFVLIAKLFVSWEKLRRTSVYRADLALQAEVLQVGAHLMFMDEPNPLATWYILRSLRVSARSGSHKSMLWGLDSVAAGASHFGLHSFCNKILSIAESLLRPTEEPGVKAVHLTRKAFVQMGQGKVREAAETWELARLPVFASNHSWEIAVYEFLRGHGLALAGDIARAAKSTRHSLSESRNHGDTLHIWAALYTLSYLGLEAPECEEMLPTEMSSGRTFRHATLGHLAAAQGHVAEAAAHHVRAADEMTFGWPMAIIPGESASAVRQVILALPPQAEGLRRDLYPEFLRGVKRAKKQAELTPIAQPIALRETAWSLVFKGDTGGALRCFRRAADKAAELELSYELWRTLKSWAQAGVALRWDSSEWCSRLRGVERSLGLEQQEQVTQFQALHLMARFDGLLRHGQSIAKSLSLPDLCESLEKAVIAVFDSPLYSLLSPTGVRLHGVFAQPSQSLLTQSLEQRRVILQADLPEPSESVVLEGVTSTLCAPVIACGKIVALVWVSHEGVEGLFGEQECTLAQYLTTLAGAAWENVERYEAVHRRRTELEEQAARNEAYFQMADAASAVFTCAGLVERHNQAWSTLGCEPEWWLDDLPRSRLIAGHEYRLTKAALDAGRQILSATPLPAQETKRIAERQRLRLSHLQNKVRQRALDPLDRFIEALEQTDDLEELARWAQATVESVSELIGELES